MRSRAEPSRAAAHHLGGWPFLPSDLREAFEPMLRATIFQSRAEEVDASRIDGQATITQHGEKALNVAGVAPREVLPWSNPCSPQ
jgi:hypothetical protein